MRPLIQELPEHYRTSPQDAELQRVLSLLAEQAEAGMTFTLDQLFPSTASGWGLALWESAYGIQPEAGQTEAQRRERVLAKVKGAGVSTPEKLLALARCFSSFPAELEQFPAEYRFLIWFTGTVSPVDQERMLQAMIDELKPAHLAWKVQYKLVLTGAVHTGAALRQSDHILFKDVRAAPGGRPEEPAAELSAEVRTSGGCRRADHILFKI